jgi:hypothetical protein
MLLRSLVRPCYCVTSVCSVGLLTICELAKLGKKAAEDVEGAEAIYPGVVDGDQQEVIDGAAAPSMPFVRLDATSVLSN